MNETIRRWIYLPADNRIGDCYPAGWHFRLLRQWQPIEQPALTAGKL
jgi:hypothetical protein